MDTEINKQILEIKQKLVKISTGVRLTSWLFTECGGVESGTTQHKFIRWQGVGFALGTTGLQIQFPNT